MSAPFPRIFPAEAAADFFWRGIVCRQQPVTQAGRVSTREAWWEKETPSNMKSVNSVEELLHEMVRTMVLCEP